ncbi:unnamed protein product [Protopolystoma xenopodis]|uniref:Uncharacterized protein n=1 Tax=Protopolystoma xenopodis TaxID=117903 RepID=A0A3S5CI86_9PLAT|nr:unnamed protein product [Protopolystoma xenopodis]
MPAPRRFDSSSLLPRPLHPGAGVPAATVTSSDGDGLCRSPPSTRLAGPIALPDTSPPHIDTARAARPARTIPIPLASPSTSPPPPDPAVCIHTHTDAVMHKQTGTESECLEASSLSDTGWSWRGEGSQLMVLGGGCVVAEISQSACRDSRASVGKSVALIGRGHCPCSARGVSCAQRQLIAGLVCSALTEASRHGPIGSGPNDVVHGLASLAYSQAVTSILRRPDGCLGRSGSAERRRRARDGVVSSLMQVVCVPNGALAEDEEGIVAGDDELAGIL